MKILLANKFYYPRGGDCIYTINLQHLLERHGHEVAVFAMQHPENLPTPWGKYFPSQVKFSAGSGLLEAALRPFGTKEVRERFDALLTDFQPDVVHLNNIHSQLSPLIAEIAHRKGIRTIWTLHDYKLLCPRYDCRRNGREACERCFTDKKHVIKNRCMKNSLAASLIAYAEARRWTREKLQKYTDIFICPSQFMADKMIQGGFSAEKMRVLANFIDAEKVAGKPGGKGSYYCYIGRLSPEKGIQTLVRVATRLRLPLKVVGDGPLLNTLRQEAVGGHIEFCGYKPWAEIKTIIENARFSVLPSECYENNPLSAIESLCLGTPVLGAKIGGIPELIDEGENGMLFTSGNADDLREKIERMFSTNFDYDLIAEKARRRFAAEKYYQEILRAYSPLHAEFPTGGDNEHTI